MHETETGLRAGDDGSLFPQTLLNLSHLAVGPVVNDCWNLGVLGTAEHVGVDLQAVPQEHGGVLLEDQVARERSLAKSELVTRWKRASLGNDGLIFEERRRVGARLSERREDGEHAEALFLKGDDAGRREEVWGSINRRLTGADEISGLQLETPAEKGRREWGKGESSGPEARGSLGDNDPPAPDAIRLKGVLLSALRFHQ